jgi:hypothetical protein
MNKTSLFPAIIRSRPKSFPEKAIVVGGFSESEEFLAGLRAALGSGLFQDVEQVTLANALKYHEDLQEAAERCTVVAHSLGPIAVRAAGAFISLNGAEPTSLLKSAVGAYRVSTNFDRISHEEGMPPIGFLDGAIETAKNPRTLLATLKLGKFSTVQMMIDGGEEAFPGGRVYLPSDKDEYGFGHHGEVERAQKAGIIAAMRDGYHDEALLHPHKTVAQIAQILEEAKR